VFVLTGAGVSAESGLSTFRDAGGAWTRLDFRDVATPEGFARDPEKVHAFYNARRANLTKAEPNAGHRALGSLQGELGARGGRLFLCTQNVDDLHERGGAAEVVHMHGELTRVRCQACGWADRRAGDLSTAVTCPQCERPGGLRPDVVWFGETPLFMDEIWEAVEASDLFVAIGTSGAVYPAAGLVEVARRSRVRTCEINLQPSDNASRFDERLYGPATEVVPAWVERLLA
jgi:NAD-dependent deacetylase